MHLTGVDSYTIKSGVDALKIVKMPCRLSFYFSCPMMQHFSGAAPLPSYAACFFFSQLLFSTYAGPGVILIERVSGVNEEKKRLDS